MCIRDRLVLSQHFPMVRFSQYDDALEATLNYPAGDLQDEESRLMELWFEYVASGLRPAGKIVQGV